MVIIVLKYDHIYQIPKGVIRTVKVLTLGAAGVLGSEIVRWLEMLPDAEQTCADIRKPTYHCPNGVNVQVDARDSSQLAPLVKGQDFIVCSLNGDWLTMAKALIAAIPQGQNTRILWVTGLGIHNEVRGLYGLYWRHYAAAYPDYIEAADTIAASCFPYTLIRTADLTEDGDSSYHLQKEGQGVNSRFVSRAAVARLITEIIADPALYRNESIGITD